MMSRSLSVLSAALIAGALSCSGRAPEGEAGARLWIGHDIAENALLEKSPAYYE